MDELKKYLQQHRQKMEEDTPSAKVLQQVLQQSKQVKKTGTLRLLYRVAAAACIAAAGLFWWMGNHQESASAVRPVAAVPSFQVPAQKPFVAIKPGTSESIAATPNITVKQSATFAAETEQLVQSFSHNYNELVNLQLQHIRNTPVYTETADYFTDFKSALQQSALNEQSIRFSIRDHGLNDQLLQQLIAVYQQKINLLKDLQREINKINSKAKEFKQPGDSLVAHYINI
ncbi:MAG: hypothetical protein JST86_15225 [Bacteroidetes bacterium]|nr:hypothetical protein [Bacteroidota bacterium]